MTESRSFHLERFEDHLTYERGLSDRTLAAFMIVSALAADLRLTAEVVEDLANRLDRARGRSRQAGGAG